MTKSVCFFNEDTHVDQNFTPNPKLASESSSEPLAPVMAKFRDFAHIGPKWPKRPKMTKKCCCFDEDTHFDQNFTPKPKFGLKTLLETPYPDSWPNVGLWPILAPNDQNVWKRPKMTKNGGFPTRILISSRISPWTPVLPQNRFFSPLARVMAKFRF